MTILEELRKALRHKNVSAFLRVIREGESSQKADAYRMMYGGQLFDSFLEHPRVPKKTPWGWTSAAGAYQFMAAVPGKVKTNTWDRIAKKYGFKDFSPDTQDLAAVALIRERKALDDLYRGDFAAALDKCSWEWASLPPGRYGQPLLSANRVYDTYQKWGGSFLPTSDPDPAPVGAVGFVAPEEPKMPMPFVASLALAALPELMKKLPDLTNIFKDRSRDSQEQYADAAAQVADIVVKATQSSGIEEAIGKLEDPGYRQAASAAIRMSFPELMQIAEFEEKSRGEARSFAKDWATMQNVRTVLFKFTFIELISLVLILISAGGAYLVLQDPNTTAEMRGALITLMLIGGFTGVREFWLGGSAGSKSKDETIKNLSER